MLKKVKIWTDGACSYNPGPGGWAAILEYNGVRKNFCGGEPLTTNNVMELTAVIKALSALKERCDVTLYSDSAYVINALNQGWLVNWQSRGYKTADNKPVKNRELWENLEKLLKTQNVTFVKVKGHADNAENNKCDELARGEIKKLIDADPSIIKNSATENAL